MNTTTCAICDSADVTAAHYDTARGTKIVAWSCEDHSAHVEARRTKGRLTAAIVKRLRRNV